MKRKLKISVAVVLGTVLLAGIAFGAFVAAMYIEAATFDVKGTPFESEYYMDEEGLFLGNIPRDEYITDGTEYMEEGERIFDIRSYGASPEADFKTNRTAINAAITEASEAGGAVVVVSDVTARNCYFFMPGIAGGYAGIAIEAVDGGKVSNVNLSNIYMDHVTSPLLIWLGYRKDGSALEDISVTGITSVGCDLPSAVVGYKKSGETHNVKNVTLSDFSVTYREAKEDTNIYLKNKVYSGKMNMGGYPEITRVSHAYFINHTLSGYYDLPVYGLYAEYTEGLTVSNFDVTPRSYNTRALSNVAF
ncbi:MAG: hypothetical protein IAB16_05095 [Firmicutes bacterium]|uniref:Uncharacterized protein n=1 Tax=Candidatus Stercoripulliclostridium pullicola TaxID=2840953 RepID=A0A940DIQ9_9FIRM|nr:hypothetical protein [Candidatus Stercoripulliclostridium pullicola]